MKLRDRKAVRKYVRDLASKLGLPPPTVRFRPTNDVARAAYDPATVTIEVMGLPVSDTSIGHEIFHFVVETQRAALEAIEMFADVVSRRMVRRFRK